MPTTATPADDSDALLLGHSKSITAKAAGLTLDAAPQAFSQADRHAIISNAAPAPSPIANSPAPIEPMSATEPVRVAQQVAQAIAATPRENGIEMRLDPPHLGRVRVDFDFSGDIVKAVVSAAEPEALSLLRRGSAALLRDLSDLGLGDIDLSFASDQSCADRDPQDEKFVFVPVQVGTQTVMDTHPHRRPLLGDRIDLIL